MEIVNTSELKDKGYYIAILDGETAQDVDSFYVEIGKSFKFPDYYGKNVPALDECINDLDWLVGYENYALIIRNSAKLLALANEKARKVAFSVLIDAIREWANVPNFEGEEKFRKKAEFKIVFE